MRVNPPSMSVKSKTTPLSGRSLASVLMAAVSRPLVSSRRSPYRHQSRRISEAFLIANAFVGYDLLSIEEAGL